MLLAVAAAGMTGDILMVAYARVIETLVFIPGIFLTLERVRPITLGDMVARIWRPVAAGLVMAGCVLTVRSALPEGPGLRLAVSVGVGALAYGGATLVLWGLAGSPPGLEAAAMGWLRTRQIPGQSRVNP